MDKQSIGTELKKYNITDAAIAKMSDEYLEMTVQGLDDKGGLELVHGARMIVKNKRVEVEKTRKELKADSLAYGKAVDAEAKRITALLVPIEEHLQGEEDRIAQIKADIAAKAAAEEAARLQAIEDERLAAIEAERVAEEKRLADIAAEQARVHKAEEERLAAIEAEQAAERERLERVAAEQAERERVAREEQETRERVVREEQEARERKLQAERDAIEAERQAIEDEKQWAADEERRAAEMEKARKQAAEDERLRIECEQAEAKAEAEQAERERVEAERIAEEERPDNEKLLAFANMLGEIEYPIVTSAKAKRTLETVKKGIESVAAAIVTEIKKKGRGK